MTGDEPGRRGNSTRTTALMVTGVLVLVAVLGAGGFVSSVAASDTATVFELDPDEVDVEPGETVQIDVVARSQGDPYGYGVGTASFAIAYDEEVLTVTDVEEGPWLADGDAEVESNVTIDEGVVEVRQQRVAGDGDEGATGSAAMATLTVEVADDAPAADVVLEFTDSSARIVDSDDRMRTFTYGGTLVVDGGGEEIAPGGDEEDDSNDEDSVGVTTAEDVDREAETDDGGDDQSTTASENPEDETDDEGAGAMPGFGPVATLVGLLWVALWSGLRGRD